MGPIFAWQKGFVSIFHPSRPGKSYSNGASLCEKIYIYKEHAGMKEKLIFISGRRWGRVHRICARIVMLFRCPGAVGALVWEKGKSDFQSLQMVI